MVRRIGFLFALILAVQPAAVFARSEKDPGALCLDGARVTYCDPSATPRTSWDTPPLPTPKATDNPYLSPSGGPLHPGESDTEALAQFFKKQPDELERFFGKLCGPINQDPPGIPVLSIIDVPIGDNTSIRCGLKGNPDDPESQNLIGACSDFLQGDLSGALGKAGPLCVVWTIDF